MTSAGKLTSMVFQDYALFPWRTVLGNVVFGPEVNGARRGRSATPRAQRLIELVSLKGAEQRYPHELSGGMRQRVALARALANDPQSCSSTSLSPCSTPRLDGHADELLRIWRETGKTFVYVTHSLQEAVLLGTRIVLMTASPGHIKRLAEVTLPRPRHLTGRAEADMLDRLDASAERGSPARDGVVDRPRTGGRSPPWPFLLLAWQVLVQAGRINPLFLPAPLSVLAAMWEMTRSGELPWAVLVSLNRRRAELRLRRR